MMPWKSQTSLVAIGCLVFGLALDAAVQIAGLIFVPIGLWIVAEVVRRWGNRDQRLRDEGATKERDDREDRDNADFKKEITAQTHTLTRWSKRQFKRQEETNQKRHDENNRKFTELLKNDVEKAEAIKGLQKDVTGITERLDKGSWHGGAVPNQQPPDEK